MLKPPTPHNETQRLHTLYSLKILDTQAEERFDRITRLARKVFSVEIALVSLVDRDRQWFKSKSGLGACETPRDISFCGHAILRDDLLIVEDACVDERFRDNPLVTDNPEIRFYAGYPLCAPDGTRIGTLCLIDSKPRGLSEDERSVFREMGKMVEDEIFALALATIDELTNISNRRGFNAIAEHLLEICRCSRKPAMLTMFDLDGFKKINDDLGHAVGDQALKIFARCLAKTLRDSDVVARLGGDEFCVLLMDADEAYSQRVIARLRNALIESEASLGAQFELSFSYGSIAFLPSRHKDISDMLREADALMYSRKRVKASPA